jgi:hypothetical protein
MTTANRGSVPPHKYPEHQSQHVSTSVKGVLISAASCSGKSYMLSSISQNSSINNLIVFEMDSLQYYWSKVLEKKLPIARREFFDWRSEQDSSALLEELSSNLSASSPEAELIKLKLLDLLISSDRFVTILPQILRHTDEGMRFIELLENYFRVRLVNVAIVPSKWRYALNFCFRLRVWNFAYVKRGLAERQMLISKSHNYDYVIRNNLYSKSEDDFLAVLERIFGCD